MIKKLINSYLERKHRNFGALPDMPDNRDYKAKEVFSFSAVNWEEKKPDDWRTFPIFNQSKSSSCIGQTIAKILGIENLLEEGKFVQFSARDIYARGYESGGGMYYRKGMKIGSEHGATVEQLMPSQGLGEPEMRVLDATVLTDAIAKIARGGHYISIELDFDDIAQIVSTGKAVALGTRFNSGGFSKPEVVLTKNGKYGHAVAVVDYCLIGGKRALIFDNSWGSSWGYKGQGVIFEDQLKGIVAAWYYKFLSNTETEQKKPKYRFEKDLKFGDNNKEVSKLQEVLKFDGTFPTNIPCTGYYGTITSKAVYAFQTNYKVASQSELDSLQGKTAGPKTRAKLNELYS